MPSSDSIRAPRLLVLANGAPVRGAMAAHVASTGSYGCDTFDVRTALSADPAMGGAFWADAAGLLVDVRVDAGSGFANLVKGLVDTVTIDPIRRVVHLTGRDRSASMIEARTQETFANRTASEIAALLAARHDQASSVQQTTTPVGRYWQLEHDRITLDQFSRATTEWDLLTGLAEREGFDVWVNGDTLNFMRAPEAIVSGAVLRPVATASGPANISALTLERSLTLAQDLTVTVKSWNSRMAQGFSQSVSNTGGSVGAVRQFNYVMPDLTPDTALQIAQRRLDELSRHERVVTAEMPGELAIVTHAMLRLEGTGTAFDQDYWVDEVVRSVDARSGFCQTVRARNVSSAPGEL